MGECFDIFDDRGNTPQAAHPSNKHLNNIFDEGKLAGDSVVAKFATTAADTKSYKTGYHNLDAIIAVGYRVKYYTSM